MRDITIQQVINTVSKVTGVPVDQITKNNGRSNGEQTIAKQLSAYCCRRFTKEREIDIRKALGYDHKSSYEYTRGTGEQRVNQEEPIIFDYYKSIKDAVLPEMSMKEAKQEAKEIVIQMIEDRAKQLPMESKSYTAINREKISSCLKEIAKEL